MSEDDIFDFGTTGDNDLLSKILHSDDSGQAAAAPSFFPVSKPARKKRSKKDFHEPPPKTAPPPESTTTKKARSTVEQSEEAVDLLEVPDEPLPPPPAEVPEVFSPTEVKPKEIPELKEAHTLLDKLRRAARERDLILRSAEEQPIVLHPPRPPSPHRAISLPILARGSSTAPAPILRPAASDAGATGSEQEGRVVLRFQPAWAHPGRRDPEASFMVRLSLDAPFSRAFARCAAHYGGTVDQYRFLLDGLPLGVDSTPRQMDCDSETQIDLSLAPGVSAPPSPPPVSHSPPVVSGEAPPTVWLVVSIPGAPPVRVKTFASQPLVPLADLFRKKLGRPYRFNFQGRTIDPVKDTPSALGMADEAVLVATPVQ
ncbi:hypothetical protein PAPYR_8705 [Paratrimastix pyriformis]|uniref:Rad60/SUMO-like domain-containing protein n=1 Tax=Paratrimastix pyriformis TaxID=342808 RepID=A0ABQ8UA43_9EUKA|nr:hypothetical protein PAPYR_8705 [Paratrimastix pyriformis]